MQLAAKIAGADAGRLQDKSGLVADYEKVYGKIGKVPGKWPALVRRVLVCQLAGDRPCERSSMEAIADAGGINTLPLNHLFEVSRFGMSVEKIRGRLHTAETAVGDPDKVAESVAMERQTPPAVPVLRSVQPSSPGGTAKPGPANAADPAPPATANANAGTGAGIKGNPKTFLQRGFARLGKLGAADAAGFFLDALFITLAVALLFAYFLFSAVRARKEERKERLRALQEIQRLEDFRIEEKVRAEREMAAEKLKAEVTLEAQKAHADDLLRTAQQAAEEAIQAERQWSAEALKTEQQRAEQIVQQEKSRAAVAIQAEQLKTEEAIKAAKVRADKAIDAYDQMAARELVYAHQHNDELQETLNAEQARREAQELKTEEVLQEVEALKAKEKKLLDIIRAEQRVRASEARQAAEKLKAAQQAAAALQASLVATRALKADLERRADEAMQAAEIRIAEMRQKYEGNAPQGAAPVSTAGESSAPMHCADGAVALKDAHGG